MEMATIQYQYKILVFKATRLLYSNLNDNIYR